MSEVCTFDARAFGAKGDGKSDDSAALQRALDAAGEAQGTVLVPEGLYLCGELRMRPGTGIQGAPAWSFRESRGSVLRLADPSAACLLNLTGAYGATVQGLCLHGGGPKSERPAHGIMISKPDYGKQEDTPRIDTCRIERFSGDGIHLERVWCFSVRHSHSFHNGGCGLWLRGWDGFILDNWLSGNMLAGFGAYEENASNTLTGNRIEWNREGGIVIRGGSHYNITGNYIDRSGRCGIDLRRRRETDCRCIAATGNVIYRSGKPDWGLDDEYDSTHARFEDCRGLAFTGNVMNAGRDDGNKGEWSPRYSMVLRGLGTSVIAGNVMHEGSLKELVVDQGGHSPDVVIRDNVGSLKRT